MHKQGAVITLTKAEPLLYVLRNYSIPKGSVKEQYFLRRFQMEEEIKLKMIQLSQVKAQEIKWLWYPFIPYGKLTIIQGDPGDGKSTFI